MRIGELAECTQTPVDTIRYYERLGLLAKPRRTSSNYRSYTPVAVERLNFIRRCRALDMSLQEVGALLLFCDEPRRQCGSVDSVLDEHIDHVEGRIAQLQRLARQLRQLRAVCKAPGTAAQCQILSSLRKALPERTPQQRRGRARASHARTSHG